jgi:hypothetical protein
MIVSQQGFGQLKAEGFLRMRFKSRHEGNRVG